jgi:uncharacterized protein YkwD
MLHSRARALRRLPLCAVLAAFLMPVAGAQAADCAGSDLVPDGSNTAQVADATLCLLNAQRAAAGLVPLSADGTLTSASTAYAGDMIAGSFFAHESPDGGTLDQRLAKVGYSYELAGENIAWGEGPLATPASIVDAWMHSEGHRTNIMDGDFRQIGLGILPGTPRAGASVFPGATYVTDFGTRPAQTSRSVPQNGTLDARATSDPIAHYAVQRKHVHRKTRRHTRRHARRHVRRNVRHRHRGTHAARRQAWQTVS